ncbi:MAG: glycosidase [Mobilitalea sp.]
MKLNKYRNNPILLPEPSNEWESLCVCNPGAWYEDGKFYLLYRAAGEDTEHYIHFGLAESEDGYQFKRVSEQPVFSPDKNSFDGGCVEDARIVKYDGTFYITYAFRPFPPGQYWKFQKDQVLQYDIPESAPSCLKKNITNSGLLNSKDLKSFRRLGRITKSNLDDRDVILFPEKINEKYVMLHRPKEWVGDEYGCKSPSIWISFSEDLMEWESSKLLLEGSYDWEEKIGGSAPPIKTSEGWLTLYHAVDKQGIYRVGAMLLDLQNPAKIIARPKEYIMEPEYDYEFDGLYKGCVFPTGNFVVDDTLFVYYGCADKYIGVATCKLEDILNFVLGR